MKPFVILFFLFTVIAGINAQSLEKLSTFKPGQVWKDTNGEVINSHGGGFLFHNGKYYWFGEHKIAGGAGNRAMVGVHCYSSADLYNWKDEGIALPVVKNDQNSPITEGCVLKRPKVIFNKKTGKFVMWFHLELKGQGYNAAQTGVAVSDNVTGPYTFLKSARANAQTWPLEMTEEQKKQTVQEKDLKGWSEEWKKAVSDGLFVRRDFEQGQMARDMTLFVDDDGKAYHIHSSEENLTLHISELSDDYTSFTGKYTRVFPAGHNEAPAIFKRNGKYYMITSGCTGWAPNAARSAVAESIWGPWKELGNPCVGDYADLTFHSQSTAVIPVQGKSDAFIFVGDLWRPENAIDGRYIFLPISFDSDQKIVLRWFDEWNLKCFGDGSTMKLDEKDMKWWQDAKFGMFIHWGLYAIPAKGEWHMFNDKVPAGEYAKYADEFNPQKFDAKEWAEIAKAAGMKYMVLTARHHDGFALWDSRSSFNNYTSMQHAAKRDFISEYTVACRKAGIKTGIYYSPMDWRFEGYFDPRNKFSNALQMSNQCQDQIRELLSNYGQIDVLWFDGGWLSHKGADKDGAWLWQPLNIIEMARGLQPNLIMSSRMGWKGDFQSDEGGGDVTGNVRAEPWEKCLNLNEVSWGYSTKQNLMPFERAIKMLVNVVFRNGNVLLNVGPDKDGQIPETHVARLKEIGQWLNQYGESIYETHGGPFQPVDNVYGSTFHGKNVYIHILKTKAGSLQIPPISNKLVAFKCLTGEKVNVKQSEKGISITVGTNTNLTDIIVKLEFEGDINFSQVMQ